MTNDIKEILNYLTKFINDKEEITKYGCEISVKQAKQLLDYITNLQQENEKLLSENITIKSIRNMVDETIYKLRCEKAVEYIKSKEDSLFMTFSDDVLDHDELIDKKIGTTLLNILNGKE